jgi:hypothetical protein
MVDRSSGLDLDSTRLRGRGRRGVGSGVVVGVVVYRPAVGVGQEPQALDGLISAYALAVEHLGRGRF